jgi:hypothetical protein
MGCKLYPGIGCKLCPEWGVNFGPEYAYAVYHGKNMQAFRSQTAKDSPETIMKFSLKDGIPLARFTTDVPVTRIAVNPDGEVYCIAKPLGYNLVKVEL